MIVLTRTVAINPTRSKTNKGNFTFFETCLLSSKRIDSKGLRSSITIKFYVVLLFGFNAQRVSA